MGIQSIQQWYSMYAQMMSRRGVVYSSRTGPAQTTVIATGDFDDWKGTTLLNKNSNTGQWTATVKVPYAETEAKQVRYKVGSVASISQLDISYTANAFIRYPLLLFDSIPR